MSARARTQSAPPRDTRAQSNRSTRARVGAASRRRFVALLTQPNPQPKNQKPTARRSRLSAASIGRRPSAKAAAAAAPAIAGSDVGPKDAPLPSLFPPELGPLAPVRRFFCGRVTTAR